MPGVEGGDESGVRRRDEDRRGFVVNMQPTYVRLRSPGIPEWRCLSLSHCCVQVIGKSARMS